MAAPLLAATVACTTSTADFVGEVYYVYGPEGALDAVHYYPVAPGERALVELERAVALLELGDYRRSGRALSRARLILEVESAVGPVASSSRAPWRPEAHERVLMHTLGIVDNLALQDIPNAAAWADTAVELMTEAPCVDCDWLFTRTAAALAYEAAGRWTDGLAVLDDVGVEGPAGGVIREIRDRLRQGASGHQPTGLAPPPVATERQLIALLLLGRGPTEAPTKLRLEDGTTLRFSEYRPYEPETMASAAIEGVGDDPATSVELTDVDALAAASLAARADGLRETGTTGAGTDARDLRHWMSLPASLHLVTADLAPEIETVDLVFRTPDGTEAVRETIELPEDWTAGRVFIVRRMP